MDELEQLLSLFQKIPQAAYPVHSRIHPLRSFQFQNVKCYVKREDELGFGISGTKIRKYRTLIPYLLNNHVQEVVVIGSVNSNHVLSLIQLLIENGLTPTLFLRGDPKRFYQGNALFISLFVPPASIHWFSKSEWKNVEAKAYEYAKKQNHYTFVVPEGGFCLEAFPGSLTLVKDILDNQNEMEIDFDHLFIEAGTGFTACSLILGLHWLKHRAKVHVVLLADDEESFLLRLKECQDMFFHFLPFPLSFPQNFLLYLPKIIRGFGKISKTLFESIQHIAQYEGFLTDPIYSARLFMEAENILKTRQLEGNVLIFHCGGALNLAGFQDRLSSPEGTINSV